MFMGLCKISSINSHRWHAEADQLSHADTTLCGPCWAGSSNYPEVSGAASHMMCLSTTAAVFFFLQTPSICFHVPQIYKVRTQPQHSLRVKYKNKLNISDLLTGHTTCFSQKWVCKLLDSGLVRNEEQKHSWGEVSVSSCFHFSWYNL